MVTVKQGRLLRTMMTWMSAGYRKAFEQTISLLSLHQCLGGHFAPKTSIVVPWSSSAAAAVPGSLAVNWSNFVMIERALSCREEMREENQDSRFKRPEWFFAGIALSRRGQGHAKSKCFSPKDLLSGHGSILPWHCSPHSIAAIIVTAIQVIHSKTIQFAGQMPSR